MSNINLSEDEKRVSKKYDDFYSFFNEETKNSVIFINEGFCCLDENGYPSVENNIELSEKFIDWKYQVILYQKILEHANIQKDAEVENLLEVGCGCGAGLSYIEDVYNVKNLYGIDINSNYLEHAKKHTKKTTYYNCSATNMDVIASDTIDVVINSFSSCYYDPLQNYTDEAYRILKDGGKLVEVILFYSDEQLNNIMESFKSSGFETRKISAVSKNIHAAGMLSKSRFIDIDNNLSKLFHDFDMQYFSHGRKTLLVTFEKNDNKK